MRLSYIVASLFTMVLLLSAIPYALADVQVLQTVHIVQTLPDTPAYRNMPPQQRKTMEQAMTKPPYQITTSQHGKVTRMDYGGYYELANPGKPTFLIISASDRSYIVQRWTYFLDNAGVAPMKVTVKRTGKTRTIQGHRCQEYLVKTVPGQPGVLTADLWTAQDIPNTPGPMAESVFNGVFVKPWPSIKG